ncbi:MAG: L-fuculose-phosphate aldolase [Fusobacteria bacterium]|nr:MAG: L-fuculose-phosphate aldolase [Fusobacteriota bacterium]KAF0228805.1 MAG: L-fuculose-phosphate [Fusobacteriota bacterium]
MLMEKERELIVQYGKKLITGGLTTGTGGNLSIFNRELGLMAIKPSGMEYFDIKKEDVVILDLAGNIIQGKRKPSSEYSMHKIFYEKRQDINAIVHTHSTYATTLACLGEKLPAIHYLIAFSGSHEVNCTPYVTFGTKELAELAYKFMEGKYAVLLGNHGLLTGGPSIEYAFSAMEEIEFCCQLYLNTKMIGGGEILSPEDIKVTLQKFSTYGQKVK